MCYLCGSFAEEELMLCCTVCHEAYHYYCISRAYTYEKFLITKNKSKWTCPKC